MVQKFAVPDLVWVLTGWRDPKGSLLALGICPPFLALSFSPLSGQTIVESGDGITGDLAHGPTRSEGSGWPQVLALSDAMAAGTVTGLASKKAASESFSPPTCAL